MSDQSLAEQVSQIAGADKFSAQTAQNLIAVLTEPKVRQMMLAAESPSDGGAALARLRKCLFCVSDRVQETIKSLGVQTDALGALRAARFDADLVMILRRIIGKKAFDGDIERVRQAFAQTAASALPPATGQEQAPATREAAPQSQPQPQRQPPAQEPAPSQQQRPRQQASNAPSADPTLNLTLGAASPSTSMAARERCASRSPAAGTRSLP